MKKVLYILCLVVLLSLFGCTIDFHNSTEPNDKDKDKEPDIVDPIDDDDKDDEETKPMKNDDKLLVAYYYGGYQPLIQQARDVFDIVNVCFASISKRTNDTGETEYYFNVSGLSGLNYFKNYHEYGIKVCISIGGWHDDSSYWNTYSEAASTEANRKMVAESILAVLEQYDLDGVDMDWEYPKAADRTNFTLLMKEISDTLKAKRSDYLVTAAVPSGSWSNARYDYAALNSVLDNFYVMTYDLDLDGGTKTRHMCDIKTMRSACANLVSCGVSTNKIIPGAAFYGRIYTVNSSTNHGLSQTYDSSKTRTVHYEYIKYYFLDNLGNGIEQYYDASSEAYYIFDTNNNYFITFDSVESVQKKWEIGSISYGGLMFWCCQDDTSNSLVKALYEKRFNTNE